MRRLLSIPLWFFFVASIIGVLLRWQVVSPIDGFHYMNFLHAHSHIMFLGWVFNVLYIGFVINHIPSGEQLIFKRIFIFLQVLTLGMLISFPLQGYGLYSIALSTLHTLVTGVFVYLFFKKTKGVNSTSLWFAKAALIFCVVSAIGPFSLGYIVANGSSKTHWYNYSIYFYLHFQYNGFFLFSVISLFAKTVEVKHEIFLKRIKSLGKPFVIVTYPLYLLSVLYANPGIVFNIISGTAATAQVVIVFMIIQSVIQYRLIQTTARPLKPYFVIVTLLFIVKVILQLLSAFPAFALMAYEFRPIVIGYLHLVLLGLISIPLLIWYHQSGLIKSYFHISMLVLVAIFIVMECLLLFSPWWQKIESIASPSFLLLICAVLLSGCCMTFALSVNVKPDKSHHAL